MNIIKPTEKYRKLLIKAEVIQENEKTLIDPTSDAMREHSSFILLQQGKIDWDITDSSLIKRIHFAITSNDCVYQTLKSKGLRSLLLEFPIEEVYTKSVPWSEREDCIYYHGRIIPGKLNIRELEKIQDAKIKMVFRGPICKAYWSDADLVDEKFKSFKEDFLRFISTNKIEYREETDSQDIIAKELNDCKFYFTLSNGEAFNLALQEAIACGAIPIARKNGAYWWAEYLMLDFNTVDQMISKYKKYHEKDLEEYSTVIAQEIKKRCSIEAIHEKYLLQLGANP